MSTPRLDRKDYNALAIGPLSPDELTSTVLEKCGVSPDQVQTLVKGAITAVEEAYGAMQKIPVEYVGGKVVGWEDVPDHTVRLRAADMAVKVAGAYPVKGQRGSMSPVIINLPEYYREEKREPKTIQS